MNKYAAESAPEWGFDGVMDMATVATDGHIESRTDTPSGSAPALCANALRVLRARYLKKDETGRVTETPEELFSRVARTLADIEQHYGANEAERDTWQERFYELMTGGRRKFRLRL